MTVGEGKLIVEEFKTDFIEFLLNILGMLINSIALLE